MQKTAIICVTSDLCTDNRVHKVCLTLQKCDYFVIQYGRLRHDNKPLNRPYFIERKKHWFNRGWQFYFEYNVRLFFYILFAKVDLVIANDIDSLPGAFMATKIRNKRLIFDAHELFSETPEIVNRPFVKRTWQTLENIYIGKVKEAYTVCESIAKYYKNKYSISIEVIRNIPLLKEINSSNTLSFAGKKIILYQGAINVGRGIEWVINAMPYINNAMLVIIGNGDIKTELEQQVNKLNLSDKVVFTGKINTEDLPYYTVCADLGLCLLEDRGLNYYYSLPNRIFDYIHAGIPVLATRFPEITAIVEKYQTGIVIDHYEADYLANTIQQLLNKSIDKGHLKSVAQTLCWENEEKKLIEIINRKA